MSSLNLHRRILIGACIALTTCGLTAQAFAQQITLSGSSTVAPLVAEIAKRFEQRHPGVRVDVQSGGSSRGISEARQGLVQVGMVSRALKADEADLTATPIALDGISVILHRSNQVPALSDAQIKAIYTGEIRNWKQLGGADRPITAVNKAEGRSTLELFLQHFQLKNRDIRAQVVIGENQQGIKTVAGNPGAIGYVSIGTAEYEAGQGTPIRLLPMAGVPATVGQVQAGKFPLSRPLNLVVKGQPSALTRQFLDFAQSKDVHDLVRAQFFVPLAR